MFQEQSWLNAFNRPKHRFEEVNCFRAVDAETIPASAVWKSIPGWIMLTRKHAGLLTVLLLPHTLSH